MGVQNVNKSKVEDLGCDACDRSFGSPKGLKLHIRKKHGKENGDASTNDGLKYQCEKCENKFTTQRCKDLHVKNYHENVQADIKEETKELKPKLEELTETKKNPTLEDSKCGIQLPAKGAKIDKDPFPHSSSRYKIKISFKCKYCYFIFGNSDDMINHHLSNHMTETRL